MNLVSHEYIVVVFSKVAGIFPFTILFSVTCRNLIMRVYVVHFIWCSVFVITWINGLVLSTASSSCSIMDDSITDMHIRKKYFEKHSSKFRNVGEEEVIEFLFAAYERNGSAEKCKVYDFGANVGEYAKMLLSLRDKYDNASCEVVAYEPNPISYNELLNRVPEENGRFHAVNKGVSSIHGSLPFYYRNVKGKKGDKLEFDIGATFDRSYAKPGGKRIKVEVITVEESLSEDIRTDVLLLKFDIEGLEFQVLKTLEKILTSFRVFAVQWERSWKGAKRHTHSIHDEISIFARHNYIVYLIGKNNSDGIVLKVWPNDLNARVMSRKFDHTYITLNFIAIASNFDGEFRKIAEKSSCDLR